MSVMSFLHTPENNLAIWMLSITRCLQALADRGGRLCVCAGRERTKFGECACVSSVSRVMMSNSLTKTQHMSRTWCLFLRNGLHHSHLIAAAAALSQRASTHTPRRTHSPTHNPSHVGTYSPTQAQVCPAIHAHSCRTLTTHTFTRPQTPAVPLSSRRPLEMMEICLLFTFFPLLLQTENVWRALNGR